MLRSGRLIVLVALLVAPLLHAAAVWPVVQSDLPPDPAIHWGTLANGLRYAVRPNAEPKGRVSLRLLVAAGSLEEHNDERGLAHFIEHMVFRGTRRHPNGSLTSELQRLGIGFGPDSTAFTFWDHTIYHLELPDTTVATLREGLSVLREYAEDVTFDPKLIDRERDVILDELHTRDTPDARSNNANLAFLWPDARQVERQPIGLEHQIRTFTRDQFVAFYNAWYRPDRMAVVVVGDIDPAQAEKLVSEVFASMQPRGPARHDRIDDIPDATSNPDIKVFIDSKLAGAGCSLENPFPDPRVPDTHAHRVEILHRALAFAMLQRRLMRSAKNSDGRYVSPLATVASPLPGWSLALVGASGKIDNWSAFMADLEQEHRRALLYGFTTDELALARAAFVTGYDEAVRTSATWPSSWIAGQIADSILHGTVYSTPALAQRDLAADLQAATPAECLAEFRHVWGTRAPHVFVSTNDYFHVTGREIAAALNASRAVAVKRPTAHKSATFAYTDFGPPGRIAHEDHVADLDVWQAEFANETRLNFKSTPYDADSVSICLRVGTGRLSQPTDAPGLDLLAEAVVAHGGLGRHTQEELADILANHAISLSFNVDSDAFDFNARCARKDLLLCLQIIAAYLTDSAYRADMMPEARASFGSMYASLAASPAGPISFAALRLLSGGDLRFGTPTPAELEARTIPEVRAWVNSQFKSGPLELGIAGDTTWEEVSSAVAATLGALPARRLRNSLPTPPPLNVPTRPQKSVYAATTDRQLHQVALAWFCLMPDLADVHQERRCRMLAALLNDLLRVRLRDELGASYDSRADFVQMDGFPNFSYFALYATVAPDHAQRANRLIQDTIEDLRRHHFSNDEFARVREPFLRARDEDLRSNSYWAYTVLRDAQQRPERLAAARDRTKDTAAITRRDVEKLARSYFRLSHWFQFVCYPGRASGIKQFGSIAHDSTDNDLTK